MQQPQYQSIQDYRLAAQQKLDPEIWRYLMDGDIDAKQCSAELAAFRLTPRALTDLRGGHTRLNLFGQTLAHPLLLAPVAYQKLYHPGAETHSVLAACAQQGQVMLSSLASQPLAQIVAEVKAEAPALPWFQLYWQGERERTLQLLRLAESAGCSAIVFTVDAPIKQANLNLPPDVRAVNLPPELPQQALSVTQRAAQSVVFDGFMTRAPNWDDFVWLRRQTALPLLIKGIMHPHDAKRAADFGADGIIVSNHGGRVLRGAISPLTALKQIAASLSKPLPLLYDGGIRSGRDAYVALAHGALAVLIGRPYIWGLAGAGALGVAHVIRLLRDELEMTMALTGCANLAEIGSTK